MSPWLRAFTGLLCAMAGLTAGVTGQQRPAPMRALEPFVLPQPSGTHAVGVIDFDVVDRARSETFSSRPGDARRIAARAWYPAERTDTVPRPYRSADETRIVSRAFASAVGLPAGVFDNLERTPTHSVTGAPIAHSERPFPLVLFSHGLFGWVDNSTALMEHLASHGYVVISVSHPYESAGVIFSDGTSVGVRQSANDERASVDPALAGFRQTLAKSSDPGERFTANVEIYAREKLASSGFIWRDDFLSVASAFRGRTAGAFAARLRDRVDATHVAYVGMSFGGSAAAGACEADATCRAAINLDGRDRNADLMNRTMREPFLMMYSDPPVPAGLRYNDYLYERLDQLGRTGRVDRLVVRGSLHWDYTDYTLIPGPDVVPLPVKGPIDGARMLRIVNDTVLSFLDQHLAGRGGPRVDDLLRQYPELTRQDLSAIRGWAQTPDGAAVIARAAGAKR